MATSGASFSTDDALHSGMNYGDLTTFDGIGTVSISGWVYHDKNSTIDCIISKWNFPNTDWSFLLEIVDVAGLFQLLIGSTVSGDFSLAPSTVAFSLNTWDFFTVTWDGSTDTFILYLNGVNVTGTKFISGGGAGATIPNKTALNYIARRDAGSISQTFNGELAHIQAHNFVLSLDQHNQLRYNPDSIPDGIIWNTPLWDATAVEVVSKTTPTLDGNAASSINGPPIFLTAGQ